MDEPNSIAFKGLSLGRNGVYIHISNVFKNEIFSFASAHNWFDPSVVVLVGFLGACHIPVRDLGNYPKDEFCVSCRGLSENNDINIIYSDNISKILKSYSNSLNLDVVTYIVDCILDFIGYDMSSEFSSAKNRCNDYYSPKIIGVRNGSVKE